MNYCNFFGREFDCGQTNYLKHVAFHLATLQPTIDPRNICAQRCVLTEASVAMTPLLVKARHGKQS